MFKLFVICILLVLEAQCRLRDILPTYVWHQVDYKVERSADEVVFPIYGGGNNRRPVTRPPIPSGNSNLNQVESENYVRYNNVPMGVNRWKDHLFITMPRRRPGIPSTLNFIHLNGRQNVDVPLVPYPDLKSNSLHAENRRGVANLVSVYRTTTDECNRLWMVDTGLLEYPGNRQRIQPPAIVVIDLLTSQVIHRYILPESVYRNTSTLASIAVDVTKPKRCDETFAYIPDLAAYGLIVYDMKRQRSWRFTHNYFNHEPLGGDFKLNNELFFQWTDGIFSIELSSRHANDGFRTAYFHPMAGTHEYMVSTRVLRNESNAERSYHGNDFVHVGDKGPDQQTSMAIMDPVNNVIFYNQVHKNGLGCRNVNKPLDESNFVLLFEDNQRYIYPSDITYDGMGNIWVMTNTMPYFIYSQLNPENINFRVWRFSTAEIIKNTKCAP